jgi:hypothetical protein
MRLTPSGTTTRQVALYQPSLRLVKSLCCTLPAGKTFFTLLPRLVLPQYEKAKSFRPVPSASLGLKAVSGEVTLNSKLSSYTPRWLTAKSSSLPHLTTFMPEPVARWRRSAPA